MCMVVFNKFAPTSTRGHSASRANLGFVTALVTYLSLFLLIKNCIQPYYMFNISLRYTQLHLSIHRPGEFVQLNPSQITLVLSMVEIRVCCPIGICKSQFKQESTIKRTQAMSFVRLQKTISKSDEVYKSRAKTADKGTPL